jgi:hypothetical protein
MTFEASVRRVRNHPVHKFEQVGIDVYENGKPFAFTTLPLDALAPVTDAMLVAIRAALRGELPAPIPDPEVVEPVQMGVSPEPDPEVA